MICDKTTVTGRDYPDWLPEDARNYLDHTGRGASLRQIAKATHRHPSTIARRVRAVEARREDPLVDEALSALHANFVSNSETTNIVPKEQSTMTAHIRPPLVSDESTVNREARRILRRLCEKEATLVLAQDMDKAIVLRAGPDGSQTRTAVLDRKVAHAFALKDWISTAKRGRVTVYRITEAGKSALKRLIDEDRKRRRRPMELAEAATPFVAQHQVWGERPVKQDDGAIRKIRVNLAESPLAMLARRKGRDGKLFLSMDLVQAGERLREDFERAQMGPRVAQNWEKFLTGSDRGAGFSDGGIGEGPRAARDRVSDAMDDLGPGLADVVMRVCCFLEGLESAEKRLGWSARSGKIVLKIGLQRLLKHYETRHGFVPVSQD